MGVQPGADAQDDTRNEGRVHFHLNLQYIKCIYHAWNDVGKAWRAHDHEGGTDQSRIRVLADVVVDSDVKPVDVYDDTDETDGRMEKCMHLSGGVAMGITIALRFVPILFGELDRIMKAQMARGADFKKGNPVVRLKKLRTVILPLFQNAISRAGHLGDAMDSRCYTGGKGRTKLHPLVYERRDVVAYVCMLAMVIASVVLIVKF